MGDVLVLRCALSELPTGTGWLGPSEHCVLAGLRHARRRNDWLIGRWTAKHLVTAWLARQGLSEGLDEIEILAAADGAPEVHLRGIRASCGLSVSHRGGVGFSALSPQGAAIGCDLERIEPHSDGLVDDFFTAAEKTLVATDDQLGRDCAVALVWSAKESALKALREGLRVDTRSVEVESLPSRVSESSAWSRLGIGYRLEGGTTRRIEGWWKHDHETVCTVASLECTSAPTEIRDNPQPRALSTESPRGSR